MREEYKKKLQEFNSTEKYKLERDFLINILQPQRGERILDYGTGLGRMVYHLNDTFGTSCYGYDLINLREKDCQFWFRNSYHFKFHKVFFMHSIAHIPDIEYKLLMLRQNLLEPEAKIYVITPNKIWIENQETPKNYIPDNTVVQHFNLGQLKKLFIDGGFKIIMCGQFGELSATHNERLFLEATI